MSMKKNTKTRFKPKYNIKKGDTVKVLSGDDKGKEGRVLMIDTAKGRAVVEGVAIVTKHKKPDAENPQGGIVHQEASIHISNLMFVDPATSEPTKVRRKVIDNKRIRVSKKTGESID